MANFFSGVSGKVASSAPASTTVQKSGERKKRKTTGGQLLSFIDRARNNMNRSDSYK